MLDVILPTQPIQYGIKKYKPLKPQVPREIFENAPCMC